MEQVKQFRKGKSDKIDFLDEIEATKGKKKFDPKQQSQHDKTKGYVCSSFFNPEVGRGLSNEGLDHSGAPIAPVPFWVPNELDS